MAINLQENVSLAGLTTFRIGGPAKYYVEVTEQSQLEEALAYAKEKALPFYVLGGGSNLLVSDRGFDGLIVRMKMGKLDFEGASMSVEAGVPLIKAVKSAADAGLAGIAALAGIPGTVGGAVRGNAGAYGCEIGSVVTDVLVFDTEKMETLNIAAKDCDFSYRSSVFKKNPKLIVLSAKLSLTPGKPEAVRQEIQETIAKRVANELQGVKSAGSFFMNPSVENEGLLKRFETEKGVAPRGGKLPAGWLIDQAGLRGKRIGDVAVNEKHANYITNVGEAKAEDVIMLVSLIKQKIRSEYGVQMQQEVNYLGF